MISTDLEIIQVIEEIIEALEANESNPGLSSLCSLKNGRVWPLSKLIKFRHLCNHDTGITP